MSHAKTNEEPVLKCERWPPSSLSHGVDGDVADGSSCYRRLHAGPCNIKRRRVDGRTLAPSALLIPVPRPPVTAAQLTIADPDPAPALATSCPQSPACSPGAYLVWTALAPEPISLDSPASSKSRICDLSSSGMEGAPHCQGRQECGPRGDDKASRRACQRRPVPHTLQIREPCSDS